MSSYNRFLNEQCIEVIMDLSNEYPSDTEFGRKVREFIHDEPNHKNQLEINFEPQRKKENKNTDLTSTDTDDY